MGARGGCSPPPSRRPDGEGARCNLVDVRVSGDAIRRVFLLQSECYWINRIRCRSAVSESADLCIIQMGFVDLGKRGTDVLRAALTHWYCGRCLLIAETRARSVRIPTTSAHAPRCTAIGYTLFGLSVFPSFVTLFEDDIEYGRLIGEVIILIY